MSSFLQSLALRESGAAAVLAPRVTGWFESPAVHAPEPMPPADPEPDAPSFTAPPPAAQPPAAPRRADAANPARPAPGVPAPTALPSLRASQAAPAPRVAPLDSPPREARHAVMAPLPAMARVIAAAAPLAPPVIPSAALPPAAADAPAPPLPGVQPELPAASPRQDASAERVLLPALRAMPVHSPRLAQAALQVAQAGAGRRASPDAPPQPVIQVTIGRLEVRAVQAASAPPAPRPRQSPTSLDDYLAQRNGARRR